MAKRVKVEIMNHYTSYSIVIELRLYLYTSSVNERKTQMAITGPYLKFLIKLIKDPQFF